MNPFKRIFCRNIGPIIILLIAPLILSAADYAVDWSTIDGGGGTSTNGQFSVSGTIGQPDAGPTMTNEQYKVIGGFWALPQAVQTPGAPTLSIALDSPGFATISWIPESGTNWVLQESLDLTTAAWTNAPSGFTNPIIVPLTRPVKFYRLHRP